MTTTTTTSKTVQTIQNKNIVKLFYAQKKPERYRILYRSVFPAHSIQPLNPTSITQYHYIIVDQPIFLDDQKIIVRSLVKPSTLCILISDILFVEFDLHSRPLTMNEINLLQKIMGFEINESLNVDSRFKVVR